MGPFSGGKILEVDPQKNILPFQLCDEHQNSTTDSTSEPRFTIRNFKSHTLVKLDHSVWFLYGRDSELYKKCQDDAITTYHNNQT